MTAAPEGQRESSLEDLYERAPCGYVSTTPDGVIIRINDTLLSWVGYERSELDGAPLSRLLSPGNQIFYETRYLPRLRLSGEVREVALSLLTADGRIFPVLLNSRVVTDSAGEPIAIRSAVFDSSERHDYERQLLAAQRLAEESESRVRVLQAASSAFGSAHTDVALAEALEASTRDALAASSCAVLVLGEDGRARLLAGTNPLDRYLASGASRPEIEAMRQASTIMISNLDEIRSTMPALASALESARVEAMSVVPLLDATDQPQGALICFFGRARSLDSHDRQLQTALAQQATQVLTRIRLQGELQRLALHDQLTGLANRVLLREQLVAALRAESSADRSVALIFLDLDGFKSINDNLGHPTGDSVLKWVARQLASVVRVHDLVGRFGGDEFVVICSDVNVDAALHIAERIRSAVQQPTEGVPEGYPISASIGVALSSPGTQDSITPEELFRLADTAMYEAKTAGGNRILAVSA